MNDTAAPPAVPLPEDLQPDQVTERALREFSRGTKTVHVSYLRFDRCQAWGQIRPINEDRVQELLSVISKDEPRVSISKLLFRQLGTGV